jgi:hypothetical protein
MHSRVTSDFLVAQPSFVSGVARLFDLYGLYDAYNMSRTAGEADYKALLSDWCIVGQDIQDAMTAFECSLPAQSREAAQFELFATR